MGKPEAASDPIVWTRRAASSGSTQLSSRSMPSAEKSVSILPRLAVSASPQMSASDRWRSASARSP